MIKYLENEKDFDKEISKEFLLVDFYADWCGPCKMLGVELENLNEDILKVNTDSFTDIAKEYGVMSIPTLVFMKDGKEVKRNIGYVNSSELEDMIRSIK